MKFIYSSDIHGDINKYENLISLCEQNKISYIVLGGDLFSKNHDKRIPVQINFINGYFRDFLNKIKEKNIELICITGNDDLVIPTNEYYKLIEKYENVHDINQTKYDVLGISFIGLKHVLDAPFKRKDNIALEEGLEMPEQWSDEIYVDNCQRIISKEEWKEYRKKCPMMEQLLRNLPKSTQNNKIIYLFHEPPYGRGLDLCKDKTIAGSKAILKFIEKSNAYMSLHGHIHESYNLSKIWNTKIGKTISIQLGQSELGEKELHYAIIDTEKDDYKMFIKHL